MTRKIPIRAWAVMNRSWFDCSAVASLYRRWNFHGSRDSSNGNAGGISRPFLSTGWKVRFGSIAAIQPIEPHLQIPDLNHLSKAQ
jgi:hypothetical protein